MSEYPPFPAPFSWLGVPFLLLCGLLELLKHPRVSLGFVFGSKATCVHLEHENNPLQVLDVHELRSAKWGSGRQVRDVTPQVRAAFVDKKNGLVSKHMIDAEWLGDPAPGAMKRLEIRYVPKTREYPLACCQLCGYLASETLTFWFAVDDFVDTVHYVSVATLLLFSSPSHSLLPAPLL